MQLLSTRYTAEHGWDVPLDAGLDSPRTLLIAFGDTNAAALEGAFAELRTTYPQALWIGGSTAGEIYQTGLADHTLVVAVLAFRHTELRLAQCRVAEPEQSYEVGSTLAAQLSAPDLKLVFVMSDGLTVNGSELTKGLSRHLPHDVVVTGGLAGDGTAFQRTWVLADKQPQSQQVVAIGFYGEQIGMAYGSRGGWDVLGAEREVTYAEGNVLYSLDGQPALTLYKKYLGDRARELPSAGLLFPLAIRNEQEEDGLTVRTILSIDEEKQSITFAGDIPQGGFVRLMRANFERLIDGAGDAVDGMNFAGYSGGPLLAVAISCVGRRLVLNQRVEEEIEAVREGLPAESHLIGFYSYGELSPLRSGRCDLHNQTMTLTAFWEHE